MSPIVSQREFGGGIFRGISAPRGCVYDAVNALVDDERLLFRRGGSTYKATADAGARIVGLAAPSFPAGERVIFWTGTAFYVLDGSSAPLQLSTDVLRPFMRPVGLGPWVAIQHETSGSVVLYGGSRKTANYVAGSIAVTQGSDVVTGTGTAWLANVDRGMILIGGQVDSPTDAAVVVDVLSDTSLRMHKPALSTLAAISYSLSPKYVALGSYIPVATSTTRVIGAFGSPPRLILCFDNRAYFTSPGSLELLTDNFHQLPPTAFIIGAETVGDVLLLFTTAGVWAIHGLALDLTDAAGNPQQSLQQVSNDLILWRDGGIAAWSGRLIVPALDDVYLMAADGSTVALSEGIRPLYRSYVAAGLLPGAGTVYRGHYFLPIVEGSGIVNDVLVCRLDLRDSRGLMRPAWTRWTGFAAGNAFARGVRTAGAPVLFGTSGGSGLRVLDDTQAFAPAAAVKADADGTAQPFSVTLNDVDTGPGNKNTVLKVRVGYELVDAASDNPVIGAWYGVDMAEGTAGLTALTGSAPEGDGSAPKSWRIMKRARRFRLRLLSSGAAATLRLKSVETFVRPSDRP